MMIPEDIKRQLRELDVEDVAYRLGIPVEKHRCRCFVHDDHRPSLSFNRRVPSQWHCFVCGAGGNAIQFVMQHQDLEFVDACRCLCGLYDIPLSGEGVITPKVRPILKRKVSQKETEPRKFNKDVCQTLLDVLTLSDKAKDFLVNERKIKEDVIEHQKIKSIDDAKNVIAELKSKYAEDVLLDSGLFTKGKDGKLWLKLFSPCLIFPYYSKDGSLIGVQSRYLGDSLEAPRFQFLSGYKSHIFNLPVLTDLSQGDELYISEGITDCLALLSDGKKAVAIPSATILPEEEIKGLEGLKVHMFPDNDKAGLTALENLRKILMNYDTSVIHHHLPKEYKDYGDYHKAGCPPINKEDVLPKIENITLESLFDGIVDWLDWEEYETNTNARIFPRLRSLFEILLVNELPDNFKHNEDVFGFSNYLVARDGFMFNWGYMSKVWFEYIKHISNYRNSVRDAIEIINSIISFLHKSKLKHMEFIINDCIQISFTDDGLYSLVKLDLDRCNGLMQQKNNLKHGLALKIKGSVIAQLNLKENKHEYKCDIKKILLPYNFLLKQ